MNVTGSYRNGKNEITKGNWNRKKNTIVGTEKPQEASELQELHPEVVKLVHSIEQVLGKSYSYTPADKTDREIFADALKDSNNYGE